MGQLVCAAANGSEAISNKVKVESCRGLDESDPHSLMVEYLDLSSWNCLERIKRYSFVGGGTSLGVSFETSAIPSPSPSPVPVFYLQIKT